MSHKNYFIEHLEKIRKTSEIVANHDINYFEHFCINPSEIDGQTISIVMTACNRSMQTYYTIKTICQSAHKNIQIIIIDDSTFDPIRTELLSNFGVFIELIKIKNKFWINPCVNYNIGFKYIKGGFVIIQNAEVCHIGDVLKYVSSNIKTNEYHVFNVANLSCHDINVRLQNIGNNLALIYGLIDSWYQHHILRTTDFHFLAAADRATFDLIGGFDFDYAMAACYDDNDFLLRIKGNSINVVNVVDGDIFGIHQWHPMSNACGLYGAIQNDQLWEVKNNYYKKNGVFLDFAGVEIDEAVRLINSLFA